MSPIPSRVKISPHPRRRAPEPPRHLGRKGLPGVTCRTSSAATSRATSSKSASTSPTSSPDARAGRAHAFLQSLREVRCRPAESVPPVHRSRQRGRWRNCELFAAPAVNVIPIPNSLDFMKPPRSLVFMTAWHNAHRTSRHPPRPTVLVLGANSGVAIAAIRSQRCSTRA